MITLGYFLQKYLRASSLNIYTIPEVRCYLIGNWIQYMFIYSIWNYIPLSQLWTGMFIKWILILFVILYLIMICSLSASYLLIIWRVIIIFNLFIIISLWILQSVDYNKIILISHITQIISSTLIYSTMGSSLESSIYEALIENIRCKIGR